MEKNATGTVSYEPNTKYKILTTKYLRMASRHLARSIAMQTLYEWDFSGMKGDTTKLTEKNIEEFGPG